MDGLLDLPERTRVHGLGPGLAAQPFRLFDLPVEIRRHILEYTDLVLPHNEVYWNQRQGFHISNCRLGCDGEDECDPQMHRGCQFRWCRETSQYSTDFRRRYMCSPGCPCWLPPQSIFTVSHAMYREAVHVLYSCNRVIVCPSDGRRSRPKYPNRTRRLDVSRFITRHMWPDVLRSLRELEIIFPNVDPQRVNPPGEPYYLDWCFAVSHLKSYANIDRLKIVVNLTTAESVISGDHLLTHYDLPLSEADRSSLIRAHGELLVPLKDLRHMAQFFVHIEWAWHWCPDHPYVGGSYEEIAPEIECIESSLEKMVMGDDYDSKAAGRMEELPSIWLYGIWDFLYMVWWSDAPINEEEEEA
ncbi:hypothetical protein BJ166DRAFT_292313 [Pestalotiopsis sp. NC0098]|nr:hypothetical protein BJ166DRAFT_292313 [Pestalotiopsis sp. NC0098]